MSGVFGEFLFTLVVAIVAAALVYLAYPRLVAFSRKRNISLPALWEDRAIVVLFLVYVCVFSALAVLRHLSFNTFGFDVGVFDQSIWNSLRGRILQLSLVYDVPTLLAQRFSPILLAFVPLYAVGDDPAVLLIFQSIALAVAVFPIYWFARQRLGRSLALAIGAAFLLYPAVEFPNLIEFHEVALATPLLAFATFFLFRGKDKAFFACVALSLLVKEEIGLTVCLFGIFMSVVQRRWRVGIPLAVFGVGSVAVLIEIVLPYLRGGEYYYFGGGFASGGGRYDYLGSSLSQVVGVVLTRPDVWLPIVVTPDKMIYLLQFLIPLAFLPILGGEVAALALPTLGTSLLSTFATQYNVASHYALPLVPFVFFASVVGMERLVRWGDRIGRLNRSALRAALVALVLVSSGASYYLQSPGPLAQHFDPFQYRSAFDARNGERYALMQETPANVMLVAQREFVPHMTHRQQIWEFPFVPDYRQADYLMIDKRMAGYFVLQSLWQSWFDTGYFETVKEEDDFVIARQRPPAHSVDIRYGGVMSLVGYTVQVTDTLHGGETLRPIVQWHADTSIDARYVIHVHLADSRGHIWATDEHEPDGGTLPTDRWPTDRNIGDQYTLKLPSTIPPDDYRLTIAVCLVNGGPCLPASGAPAQSVTDDPVVATVHIDKDHTSLTASDLPIQVPLFVDMGEVRFLGFVPPRTSITAGEPFSLGVYWRARGTPKGDYEVSVQLRDANGRVVLENASRPANGAYPTTEWVAGEVLLDWHDFEVPRDLSPGDYSVYVVLRGAGGGEVLGQARVAPLTVVN